MKTSRWIGVLGRAKDEVIKVSQIGKAQVNRSFLLHERKKLYRKLGEKVYSLVKEKQLHSESLDRLVDQLDRMNKKILEVENHMKELIKHFSSRLDAEEQTDVVKRRGKRKK